MFDTSSQSYHVPTRPKRSILYSLRGNKRRWISIWMTIWGRYLKIGARSVCLWSWTLVTTTKNAVRVQTLKIITLYNLPIYQLPTYPYTAMLKWLLPDFDTMRFDFVHIVFSWCMRHEPGSYSKDIRRFVKYWWAHQSIGLRLERNIPDFWGILSPSYVVW